MNRSLRTHVCFTFSSSLRIRSLSSNAFISKCRFSSSDMRFHIFTSARFTSFVFHSAHKPDHSHKRGFCARISSRFSLQKYMYAERARAAEMEEFRLDRFRSSVLSFTSQSSRYVNPRAFSSFRYRFLSSASSCLYGCPSKHPSNPTSFCSGVKLFHSSPSRRLTSIGLMSTRHSPLVLSIPTRVGFLDPRAMLQTVENIRATRFLWEFVRLVVRNGDLARPRFDLTIARAR